MRRKAGADHTRSSTFRTRPSRDDSARPSPSAGNHLLILRSLHAGARPRNTVADRANARECQTGRSSVRNRFRRTLRPVPANSSHRDARAFEVTHVKLPALCLAAAFAGGVAVGLFTALANLRSSLAAVVAAFVLSIALLGLSAAFFKGKINRVAGTRLFGHCFLFSVLLTALSRR